MWNVEEKHYILNENAILLDQNLHTKHIIKTFFYTSALLGVWLSLLEADLGSRKWNLFSKYLRFVIFTFHDDLFQSNFVTYKLICKWRGRVSYDVKSIPARAEFWISEKAQWE